MSKSDTPVELIETDRARKPLGKPDFAGDTAIAGLDTETADGDIFAIAAYYADSGEYVEIVNDGRPIGGLEILEFLTSRKMSETMNVWYNLNFDVNVVLKALPRENLEDIRIHGSTDFEVDGKEFSITYIPKKALKIGVDGKSYVHYDASQFTYSGGLDDATGDWLDDADGKADENIDVEKFGLNDDGSLNDYIAENITEIARYLRVDCRLTAEIMREIVDTAENEVEPPIPFGKPFSTGYVAADYIRNRLDYKPGYVAEQVQSAAWKTYRGGRFEVIRRGDIGDVAGPDINSAYPAVMSELPDPATLDWGKFGPDAPNSTDEIDLDEADYGFLKVRVTTDASRPVQPFAVKNPNEGNRVEYPAVDDAEIWVLKDIFEYAEAEGFVLDYDIKKAVLGFENDGTKYPFRFFKDLYSKRKNLEAEGRGKAAKLLKIVMNSIYGKTCQTTVKHKDPAELLEDKEGEQSGRLRKQDIPDRYDLVTDHRGEPYLEYQTAGRLFNPFLATYITGMTRLQLFRGVVDNDLEDSVVMLATDCLMFDKDDFEGTDIHTKAEADPDDYAEALGGWDYDYIGDGFVVGSGIYQVDRYDKDETKFGLRGFKDFYSDSNDFDTITEAAREYPDGIPVTTTRPVTYGDILHKGGKLSDIGRFRETERKLSADMDTKRNWERESPDFADLLADDEGSRPKVYDGDRLK